MRPVSLALGAALLQGCLYSPIERPMYAEVIPDLRVATLTFDADGALHALYWTSDGMLRYGTFEERGDWRFGTNDPLTLNGATIADQFFLDIAARPGTDEIWVWVGGTIGRIEGTEIVPVHTFETIGGVYQGGLAFEDENTLHSGVLRGLWQVFPVEGDALGTPEEIDLGFSPTPAVPCDIDIADGYAYASLCGDEYRLVLDLETRQMVSSEVPAWHTEDVNSVYIQSTGAIAVTEGLGWLQRPNMLSGCRLPTRDGFFVFDQRGAKVFDDMCDSYDYFGPIPTYADIAPSGEAVAMAFYGGPLVMMSDKRPAASVTKKAGIWCPTVGFDTGPITLGEDGSMFWPGDGSQILYTEVTWKQGRDTITVDLHNPDTSLTQGDERFEMWAMRVGDTLHLRNHTHERPQEHANNSGFSGLNGIYTLCQ